MGVWPPEFEYQGRHMRLQPLSLDHLEGLQEAASEGDLFKIWITPVPAPDAMEAEINRRLSLREAGSMLPFTVFDEEGRICGQTTYMNIGAANRRLEIGHTWYAKWAQRTGVNTETKLALLTNAFENLDCIAVEFCTNALNHDSRAAIERIGAKLDGIRRSHQIWRGTLRDTAVYSIIASEWPAIKSHLNWKLER